MILIAGSAAAGVTTDLSRETIVAEMQEDQLARLRDAFSHRCVSAWLGYGDPLFLGFGDHIIPPRRPGELRERPPYGLASNFASWRVDGPVAAQWTDDDDSSIQHARLEAAAESLIGERVLEWEVLERHGLRLVFSGSKILVIEPWPASDGLADAWSLSAPDDYILAVSNDGRSVIVPAEIPIRDWFPDLDP